MEFCSDESKTKNQKQTNATAFTSIMVGWQQKSWRLTPRQIKPLWVCEKTHSFPVFSPNPTDPLTRGCVDRVCLLHLCRGSE